MDEHTPIDVPIRLEEWDRHDCINRELRATLHSYMED